MKLMKNSVRHVLRGGSYDNSSKYLRYMYPDWYSPANWGRINGFRFVVRRQG